MVDAAQGFTQERFTKALLYYSNVQPRFSPNFKEPAAVHFWFSEFGELSPFEFKRAMDSCMRTLDRFPSIKDVKTALGQNTLSPSEHAKDIAKETAARINSAVSKFGSVINNDHRLQRVKDYVGELGWAVIDRQGGWNYICEIHTPQNMTQLQAQWRDLAESLARRSQFEDIDRAPKLKQTEEFCQKLLDCSTIVDLAASKEGAENDI